MMPQRDGLRRQSGRAEQNEWNGLCSKFFDAVNQAKRHVNSLSTSICNKARMIHNKMDRLSGQSSVGYGAVVAMKFVFILFMTVVAVECVYHFRSWFWLLCRLSISLACYAVKITLNCALYAFYGILKIVMGSLRIAINCFWSTTLFALYGVFTNLHYLITSFSDWALNLRTDWRSFFQLCFFCVVVIMLLYWNKCGTRNFCVKVSCAIEVVKRPFDSMFAVGSNHAKLTRHDKVSSAIKKAKRYFDSMFLTLNTCRRIIQDKLDRLSTHSFAGYIAATAIKVWVMSFVTAIVFKCVWLAMEHLFILFICLFCLAAMFIFEGTRKIIENTSVFFQNILISFNKIFMELTNAGCETTLYRWQFREADSYWWENFGPSDDVTLEKLYCDVNNLEVQLNLTNTSLSASSSQVTVNFEEMSMHSPTTAQFLLHRWSTPSFVQEPNNKSSTQWVWYWKDSDGWKKYAEAMRSSGDIQREIEAAYLNEEGTFSFRSDPHNYILKFYETPMYQMNINPDIHTMRTVRRRPVFVSKPTYQTKKSYPRGMAIDFERNCLENESEEYQDVSERFHETMPEHQASIVMVEKIWNEELLDRYESKRKRIKRKLRAKRYDEIEKLLFHGTSSDVIDAICKQNFDHRVRGKHGTKYGEGSYFAKDASYSNNYSSLSGEKTRFMFLAKVLTGEYKLGEKGFLRPPLKDPNNPASDLYDSCVDDEIQPKIFVIFNDEQCYPSYLIKYKLP